MVLVVVAAVAGAAGAGGFRPALRLLGLVGVPGDGLGAGLTPGGRKMNTEKAEVRQYSSIADRALILHVMFNPGTTYNPEAHQE